MIRERTMRAENRAGTVSKEFASGDLHSVTTVYTTSGSRRSLATIRDDGATWITHRDYRFNGSPLYWYRTTYDAEGRPTETEDSFTATRTWLYNRRSELVGASGNGNVPYSFTYGYDSIGNRTAASENGAQSTYAANSPNQYTAINRTIEQSEQSNNLTYDADGNLTQDERNVYAYDDENRLVSVTPLSPQFGSRSIENVYDHQSRRVKKIVRFHDGMSWSVASTHTFVWDGWNIVLEQIDYIDNTTRIIEYFWGNDLSGTEQGAGGVGGLLAVAVDGTFYIPVYDNNGNIVMYVSESGAIAAQYIYDPYGNILQSSGPLADRFAFGFSTKYHDWETDLIAYQLRTYTPTHGRWLNRDPIGEVGGENLYAFVDNSPMQWNDSIGLIVSRETTRFYDISTVPSMRWGMRRYTLRFSADNSIRIVEGTVPLGV